MRSWQAGWKQSALFSGLKQWHHRLMQIFIQGSSQKYNRKGEVEAFQWLHFASEFPAFTTVWSFPYKLFLQSKFANLLHPFSGCSSQFFFKKKKIHFCWWSWHLYMFLWNSDISSILVLPYQFPTCNMMFVTWASKESLENSFLEVLFLAVSSFIQSKVQATGEPKMT